MGSGTFFSKIASKDPFAQAIDAPGAHKYAQQQAETAASKGVAGPWAGKQATLADAQSGYQPGANATGMAVGTNSQGVMQTPGQVTPQPLFGQQQRPPATGGMTGANTQPLYNPSKMWS